MAIANIGLWPKLVVDNFTGCPIAGDPPTVSSESGLFITQPLSSLDFQNQIYFSWKVKKWKVDVDFTATIEWEREGDEGLETGTTPATRTDSFFIEASDSSFQTITNQQKIGCEFQGWSNVLFFFIYDGGIDFRFSKTRDSQFYSISNTGPLAFFSFNVPVEITFNGQTINSEFYASIGNAPDEIYDENPPYRFMTGASFSSGKITISEEETW